MTSVLKIRNVTFGEGIPKLCIPLTDTCFEDLQAAAAELKDFPFDLVEWRADFYKAILLPPACHKALCTLRGLLGEAPLLFTIRSFEEGGNLQITTEGYKQLIYRAIDSGLADLVDVEFSKGEDTMNDIVSAAHASGVKILASSHDFFATPSKEAIVDRLCRMQEAGADIVKLAAMPQSARDVLTLLDATLTMKEKHMAAPVVTMSMGQQGVISRICGEVFGSAITFGTAGRASAPGQLSADLLSLLLNSM